MCPGVTAKVEEPKYKKDKQLNEKISLFRGDITKLEVDAIVNAGEWGLVAGPSRRGGGCLVTSAPARDARRGRAPPGSGEARVARWGWLAGASGTQLVGREDSLPLKP